MFLSKKNLDNLYSKITFIIIFSTISFLFFFTYGKDYKVAPLSYLDKKYTKERIINLEEVDKNKIDEDMLVVDLSNMKISIVQKGEIIKDFKIISIGRPGSYYETPAGNYQIKGKYGNKFSNLGQV